LAVITFFAKAILEASVEVLAGNGDGTFAAPLFFGAGECPQFMSSGILRSTQSQPDLVFIGSPLVSRGIGTIVGANLVNHSGT
jgi:hypothetical protein